MRTRLGGTRWTHWLLALSASVCWAAVACSDDVDRTPSGGPIVGSGGSGNTGNTGTGATGNIGTGGSGNTGNTATGGSGNTGNTSDCGHQGDAEPPAMQGMTAAHNAVRCALPSPGPSPPLQWSTSLAAVAQSWADTLVADNCQNIHHSSNGYGENLMWGSGSYSPQDAVNMWMSEEGCFTYGEFPGCCSCTCGHYTQIVWASSVHLGCAKGTCSNTEVWVCNYDPPGNYMGQLPY